MNVDIAGDIPAPESSPPTPTDIERSPFVLGRISIRSDLNLALHKLIVLGGSDEPSRLRVFVEREHTVEIVLAELVASTVG